MTPRLRRSIGYLIVVTVSFVAGFLISTNIEYQKHRRVVNGFVSVGMIDDLTTMNAIHNGDLETAITQLHANVFGGLTGWDSTGMIEEVIAREPESSPLISDVQNALRLAQEYSDAYHSPEVAKYYNEIFSKYRTHNK